MNKLLLNYYNYYTSPINTAELSKCPAKQSQNAKGTIIGYQFPAQLSEFANGSKLASTPVS